MDSSFRKDMRNVRWEGDGCFALVLTAPRVIYGGFDQIGFLFQPISRFHPFINQLVGLRNLFIISFHKLVIRFNGLGLVIGLFSLVFSISYKIQLFHIANSSLILP